MATTIKLRLHKSAPNLESVQASPGLSDLPLDPEFGLVPLNPRDSLYAVRTDSVDNLEERRQLNPEILGTYGDVRISSTEAPREVQF